MRPAVATVLSALPWERELVTTARMGGMVRILGRCRSAFDVDQHLERIDALVVGAETGWLSAALLRRWRANGITVIGVVAPGDRPAHRLMTTGGADAVFDHHEPPIRLLTAIVSLTPAIRPPASVAALATVVGPRGSPGRSEVALALAWTVAGRRRTLLAEVDAEAPGLGIRLGLDPGPGLERSDPALGTPAHYRRHDPIELLTLPLGAGPLSRSLTVRVIEMARQEFGAVVIDGGPVSPETLGHDPGVPILVVNPTPAGLVRAGRMVAEWSAPTPMVVANRVPVDSRDAIRMVRAATGLEPAAVIPALRAPHCGDPPSPVMIDALAEVAREIFGMARSRLAR